MTKTNESTEDPVRQSTGIAGLDDILGGGLPRNRLYLVKGIPGVGKTTLALQFLLEGARCGERVLYITLSETEAEIRQVVQSHGWSLDGVHLFELSNAEQALQLDDENTLYSAADVDLKETVRVFLDEIERLRPSRVVFDSMSELRLLSQTAIRYRRQLLALKQYFADHDYTILLLDDQSSGVGDVQIESLAHGVIVLEQEAVGYGADRRRVRVAKLRGSAFRSGYHDFVLRRGGLRVFPRLIAQEHRTDVIAEHVPSGVRELDTVLGGGLARSTATLLIGPAGSGKSAVASQFARCAAERGERVTIFLFEERLATLRQRATLLGMSLDPFLESGLVVIHQIDPAELAPDEFSHLVRDSVENAGSRVVVIDSINGYYSAMPEGRFLTLQMHELLSYLSEKGVATMLTMAQSGLVGATMTTPVDVSYLADTILMFRYFEDRGRVRKAISVVKKRSGPHENSIRELILVEGGIRLGEPLSDLRGVLSGTPYTTRAPVDV